MKFCYSLILWEQFSFGVSASRGVTGIFFWGGKVIFPDFFSGVKCFFPVENFHFGTPKTNFHRFRKKKKKRSSPLFITFPTSISNFPPFLSQFSFFSSQFSPLCPFFPCLFFPDTSAKISRLEVSGGTLLPATPLPVTPLSASTIIGKWWWLCTLNTLVNSLGRYVHIIKI